MSYRPILATLGYLLSPDGQSVLMIHRDQRADDPHFGKYNGLGGKLRADEDVFGGLVREVREESGLECRECVLRGTISWPGFGLGGEDWFGFIFRVERWSGELIAFSPEGSLRWVPVEEMHTLPLWDGDRLFLPLVLSPEPKQFHAVMPYRDGKPVGWSYHTL